MIPVMLVKVPNYNGFLGSFDNVKWWLSEPFPETVIDITDAYWIYANYHVCATKNSDLTYSIYQTKDNGFSWFEVYNTPNKILCIVRPDYGYALASTDGGWIASANSGRDWTQISAQAPGCFCVKEITRDRLIALDGTYVWWSSDRGANWTKAVAHGTSTALVAKTQHPSMDGTFTDLFVGCISTNAPYYHSIHNWYYGPFTSSQFTGVKVDSPPSDATDNLIYSEDGGVSFYKLRPFRGWAYREANVSSSPTGYSLNNGWEDGYYTRDTVYQTFPRACYYDVITDIELTGVNAAGLCQMVIQVKMQGGILRHYWVRTIIEDSVYLNAKLWVIARFDAKSSIYNSIMSEEAQITGLTDIQHIAVFAGTTVDGKPLLKSSSNGGKDWVDYDLTNAQIYSGPDLSTISSVGGPFIDDTMIQYAWKYPICHNGFHKTAGYLEKCQSYDMTKSILAMRTLTDEMRLSTALGLHRSEDVGLDVPLSKKMSKTYGLKVPVLNSRSYSHRLGTPILKHLSHEHDMSVISVLRKEKVLTLRTLVEKAFGKPWMLQALLRGDVAYGYGMRVTILNDRTDAIFLSIDKFTSQQWDIRPPNWPSGVHDSRKEDLDESIGS